MIETRTKLNELKDAWARAYQKEPARILVCGGTGCVANGSLKIFEAIQAEVARRGALIQVEMMLENGENIPEKGTTVVKSGCHGFCELGPLVRLEPSGVLYTKVKCEDAAEIVTALLDGKEPVERLLYHHPVTGALYAKEMQIPFYQHQTRNVLEHCGAIDPEEIRETIAEGGYQASGYGGSERDSGRTGRPEFRVGVGQRFLVEQDRQVALVRDVEEDGQHAGDEGHRAQLEQRQVSQVPDQRHCRDRRGAQHVAPHHQPVAGDPVDDDAGRGGDDEKGQ